MTIDRELFKQAFAFLERKPRALADVLSLVSNLYEVLPAVTASDLFSHLRLSDANDSVRLQFGLLLAQLDYLAEGAWVQGTKRNTVERRRAIYESLSLREEQRTFCDQVFPYFPVLDDPILISSDEEWSRW